MNHALNIVTSTIASSIRSWRGTSASKTSQPPAKTLILFDREGCPQCRFVREALTELNLDVIIKPCPQGGNAITQLKLETGSSELPLLIDENTEQQIRGAEAAVNYLFERYRGKRPPKQLLANRFNQLASSLASGIRFNAGTVAKPSKGADKPLTLYSFESSPFSRPVRELLCELELPYLLVTLGKQQKSDMGPANFRFTLKPYQPIANSKRDAFFKAHGNVQVPYLIDPNTGISLFESADIIKYLNDTYAA
ncbi:glutathione S-transferase N-terminal domain-containing protein [Alkalimarinus sediminis]|uniref:Glutathione S-transferase N-terminal domain-containing protein n=1 Tax=Alkalimarinus sediminis TaxID=1632866 RepID=A0A9E8HJB7_9ALTE|nr:glutathione S-transferase N-terminal domain-containing protein [Alkalimarinus sediminis]UZW75227.1 glutathione S-transferase N-terminal domain-containing protein [Alkalimarinus sediminis]